MISARLGAGTRRQRSNACLAAETASSTSRLSERWNTPITSRVSAGFRFSYVWPLRDSTHSPPMKFLKTLAAIDTEVAFRWDQTLYRTKILGIRVPAVQWTEQCTA